MMPFLVGTVRPPWVRTVQGAKVRRGQEVSLYRCPEDQGVRPPWTVVRPRTVLDNQTVCAHLLLWTCRLREVLGLVPLVFKAS